MKKPATGGLVYSTDSGRMCPTCRKPIAGCVCGAPLRPLGDGIVRVSRETKGRGGRAVTVVRGLMLDDAALAGRSGAPHTQSAIGLRQVGHMRPLSVEYTSPPVAGFFIAQVSSVRWNQRANSRPSGIVSTSTGDGP